MNRENELEVVTTAYFLEERTKELNRGKLELVMNRPQKPSMPQKPLEERVDVSPIPYPPITPDKIQMPGKWKEVLIISLGGSFIVTAVAAFLPLFFALIGFLFSTVLFFGGIYFTIKIYGQEKSEKKRLATEAVERIKNSAEYREKCNEIDQQNRVRQAQMDEECHNKYVQRYEEYKKAVQQYDVDVKVYEEEQIPEWEEENSSLHTALADTQNALQEVYNKNIIPIQYRKLEALVYLATFLNTSQYDLKFAIENYNQYVIQRKQDKQITLQQAQLDVAKEIRNNTDYANWLDEQSLEIAENGNDILKSISNWQKADVSYRMYERHKAKKAAKRYRR